MDLKLQGKSPKFSDREPGFNYYRVGIILLLIVGAVLVLREFGIDAGSRILPLIYVTPTPTRSAEAYLADAQAHLAAGEIDDPTGEDALEAYRRALELDPGNARAWADLARLLTYTSGLLASPEAAEERMEEARETIHTAEEIASDDGRVQAVKTLVYNWSAAAASDPDQRNEWLLLAEQIAVNALALDPDDPLALAYYAEVLLDQGKMPQAVDYARRAVDLQPDVMDTRRVYAEVLEASGQLDLAIQEYDAAITLQPNLTFLYVHCGSIYGALGNFEASLECYNTAINLNAVNGVRDPQPYLDIAKIYFQMGDFPNAAASVEQALALDPTNPYIYGRLGVIYTRGRDYERALPTLNCPVQGCSVEEANELLAELLPDAGVRVAEPVPELSLSDRQAAYYYAQYGSVLAALSVDGEAVCPQALAVLEGVRHAYPDDPDLMRIVEENEEICRLLAETPTPTVEE